MHVRALVWDTPINALEKLGLIHALKLVNATPLFFARKAPMQLRCATFAATDSATIIDRHDFDGDILELIEEAQKYIIKNIHIGMRVKGLYREDVPEISVEAMREAIINAFCHRDYRDPDYVQIAVFKDRVEIRSPGGLFGGLTIAKIRKGNVSRRRNPLIADLFRRIQMVEAWGRGMPLILKNEPNAKFREIAGVFITSFDRPSFLENSAKETIDKTIGKTIDKTLSTTEKTIMEAVAQNSRVTQKELAAKLTLSEIGIRYHTDKLKSKGILKRIGGRKTGHWEILK